MSPIDDATREELSALLDGALPEPRAAELRRRLRSDEALRREYEALRRTVAAVRALPHAPAPPELRARIGAAIAGRPARGAIFRFGMLAAAASVVLAAGLVYFLRGGPSRSYEATEPARDPVREDRIGAPVRQVDGNGLGDALAPPTDSAPGGERGAALPADESFRVRPRVDVHLEEGATPAPGAARALEEKEEDAPPANPPARDSAAPSVAEEPIKKVHVDSRGAKSKPQEVTEQGAAVEPKDSELLRLVETKRRLATGDRESYLRQLGALEPGKARAHILAVFAEDAKVGKVFEGSRRGGREALDRDAGTVPLLAAVTLADREEANLVTRILGAVPVAEGEAASAGALFATAAKDQIASEIEGTPDELTRIRRWLALVDLDRAAAPPPDAVVFGQAAKAKAAPEKVRALVRLRYRPPPEAARPTAPAPGAR